MTGSRVVTWGKKKARDRDKERRGERENRKPSAITGELLSS